MPISEVANTANEVRVLVVEDHEVTRYAYTSLMRQRGYVVTGASNAKEALDATVSMQPHCILLDLGLPDMEGAELARQLRERQGSSIVIIAITGIADSAVHDAAEAAGVDYLLQKPLDVDRLAAIMPLIG